MISKQGKTIARLGEELADYDEWNLGGRFFDGDSNAARGAIIDALFKFENTWRLQTTGRNGRRRTLYRSCRTAKRAVVLRKLPYDIRRISAIQRNRIARIVEKIR